MKNLMLMLPVVALGYYFRFGSKKWLARDIAIAMQGKQVWKDMTVEAQKETIASLSKDQSITELRKYLTQVQKEAKMLPI